MNKSIKYTLVIVAVLLIAGAGYYYVDKTLTANAIRNARMAEIRYEDYVDWLAENCKCLEKNRFFCSEGFELKDKLCFSLDGKEYTHMLISCSKYDCSGDIKEFNFAENKWDILEDFEN